MLIDQDVNEGNASVADLLIAANLQLRSALTVLQQWTSELESTDQQEPPSVDSAVPGRNVVERLLDRHQKRLDDLSESDNQSVEHTHRQCMASRKLFLLCHFAATLYPDMWIEGRLKRLLDSQNLLIRRMRDGSPSRQSISHRKTRIEESPVLNPWN